MRKTVKARLSLAVIVVALIPLEMAFAANCSNPPMPPGGRLSGAWWNSYSSWCRACGGTPFQDNTGGGCRQGPNWGGQSSASGSGASTMPFSMPSTGNAQQDLALGMAQLGTQMIVQGLLSGSQETPEQRAQREEQARRAEEEAERRAAEEARQKELQHQDLVASLMPIPGATPSPTSPGTQNSTYFGKGLNDAAQCYPQNAFGYCAGVSPEQQEACAADYRNGFDVGDKQRMAAMDEAHRAGEQDGRTGKPNSSFTDRRAQGPCRTQWIENYNRGHFQGKASRPETQPISEGEVLRDAVADGPKNPVAVANWSGTWSDVDKELVQSALGGLKDKELRNWIAANAQFDRFKDDTFSPLTASGSTLRFKDDFFKSDPAKRENLFAFEAGKVFWNKMKDRPVEGGKTLDVWFSGYAAGRQSLIGEMKATKHRNQSLPTSDLIDGASQFVHVFRAQALQLNQPKGQRAKQDWDGSLREFQARIDPLLQEDR